MSTSIEQHRAAIGKFYNYCHGTKFLNGAIPCARPPFTWCLILCNQHAVLFFAALCVLLSGDIEVNPGPPNSETEASNHSYGTNSFNTIRSLKHSLSLVHLNVHSITSDEKLSQISIELGNFDVIGLTETLLDDSISDSQIAIDGFLPPFRKDRNRHGGGVAVYVSDRLVAQRCPDFEDKEIELIWLKLSWAKSNIYLACTYRPPNSQASYWEKLSNSLAKVLDIGTAEVFLVGDLNNNYYENINDLKQLAIVQNLVQLIDEPTRIPSNTLLDPILTNVPNLVLESGVLDPFCSDHKPVYACLDLAMNKVSTFKRTIWDFRNANFGTFRDKLGEINWLEILGNDPETAATQFTDVLLRVAKETIPSKSVTIRQGDKPWMHNEIRIEIRKRKRLHRRAKSTNTPENWARFRNQRNKVVTLVREAKSNYHEKIVSNINTPGEVTPRKWWNLCKSVYTDKATIKKGIPALQHNDSVVADDKEKAELLNNYFASISNIDTANARLPQIEPPDNLSLDSINITEKDVFDIIKTLKQSKACGPDNISHTLLREAAPVISKPLSQLFMMSLSSGKFPSTWKQANVCPIYKKGDPHNCSNYRPISLLSCTGKLFERCVFKYLFNYLRDNDLLSPDQSGYIPGDSTVCQLTTLYNSICKALDEKNSVQFIFFDLSKAFDRVWHEGLIYKLRLFGVRGHLLSWFQDYLTERQQRVVLGGKYSDWKTISAGVPQGSVLGPLLFLIYIDDLAKLINCFKKLFADDTCIYKILRVRQDFRFVHHDLNRMAGWETDSAQKFNPDKTESLLVSLKAYEPIADEQLDFKGHPIKKVDHHRHLGVTLSSKATWYEHILTICRTASKRISMLRGLKYKLNRQALQTIYFSFIRPTFEYADVVWGHAPRHQIYYELMEKLQLEAARIVTGTNRSISRAKLYEETGWEPLARRREKHRLILFYKMVNGLAPKHLSDLLPESRQTLYNLRNSNDPDPPFCRTETYRQSFIPATTRDWNILPPDLKSAPSLGSFKVRLDKHFKKTKPPSYYFFGSRNTNLIMSCIRNGVSKLNHDLFKNHVTEEPSCRCGHAEETAFHYFFECLRYTVYRDVMFNTILGIGRDVHLNIDTLLKGDSQLSVVDNERLHNAVSDYITSTRRFD